MVIFNIAFLHQITLQAKMMCFMSTAGQQKELNHHFSHKDKKLYYRFHKERWNVLHVKQFYVVQMFSVLCTSP